MNNNLAILNMLYVKEDTVKNEESLCQTKIEMSSLSNLEMSPHSYPHPITIRTYSTGIMQTTLSGIMNLEHEKAQNIKDKVIEIPVNVGIIQHQEIGVCLIYAGLDQAYVHNPHGTIKGLMVKIYLEKVSREPKTHIAAILNAEACPL